MRPTQKHCTCIYSCANKSKSDKLADGSCLMELSMKCLNLWMLERVNSCDFRSKTKNSKIQGFMNLEVVAKYFIAERFVKNTDECLHRQK